MSLQTRRRAGSLHEDGVIAHRFSKASTRLTEGISARKLSPRSSAHKSPQPKGTGSMKKAKNAGTSPQKKPPSAADSTEERLPEKAPPVGKPKQPEMPAAQDSERPDCWHDDMYSRAGAPPCKSPGVPDVQGSAKVALLFMTNNRIPTEPVWTAFIASAAELTLRKRVPPTQPSLPHLLPPIDSSSEELGTTCWDHGGDLIPFGVQPRESFKGTECLVGTGLHAHRIEHLSSIHAHC